MRVNLKLPTWVCGTNPSTLERMQIQKELAANQKLLEEALQNEETNNVKANEVPS